ncbi:MAG: MotA/TolQ/ExbB proton channel family protein [Candidatus Spyradosoma sp.]
MQTFFLPEFFANTHGMLWYWEQCDGAARVVIGVIAVLSIWSISSIFGKWLDVRRFRADNARFEARILGAKLTRLSLERRPGASHYERVAFEACRAYAKNGAAVRTEEDIEICIRHVENGIQRGLARVMEDYEKSLLLLSSFASGGPFLGLLGTVWGIIVTFGSLTEKATIAQLAPGVAGALCATLAGLLLAIPAVFCYNYLLSNTKKLTVEIEAFASLLTDRFELELHEALRDARRGTEPVPAPAAETPRAPAAGTFRNPYVDEAAN